MKPDLARLPAPTLEMESRTCVDSEEGRCLRERINIRMAFPRAGFYGAMNISGSALAWSFTGKTWLPNRDGMDRVVRFVGAHGSEQWHFWVRVSLSASELLSEVALQSLLVVCKLHGTEDRTHAS